MMLKHSIVNSYFSKFSQFISTPPVSLVSGSRNLNELIDFARILTKVKAIYMKTIELGAVHLNVNNVEKTKKYYEQLGFNAIETEDGIELAIGGKTLLVLHPTTPSRRHEVGLYHFALLLPERNDLGNFLYHAAANKIPITGFSDHNVSEAIYLSDPEGNGIEVYWDKPEDEWRIGGKISMTTDPMDIDGVLEARTSNSQDQFPDGTVMGHIHLHVLDLEQSDRHYKDTLGLEKMLDYPMAGFFSRDGYHHHMGMNTWLQGNPKTKEDGYPGIRKFEIHLESSVFDNLFDPELKMVDQRDPNDILYTVYRGFN